MTQANMCMRHVNLAQMLLWLAARLVRGLCDWTGHTYYVDVPLATMTTKRAKA